MNCLFAGDNQTDLVGDFSRAFCLPHTSGKHQDLKYILPDTVSTDSSASFQSFVIQWWI
jgi:hypothetical protein